jgi:hypothetical protein
LPSNSTGYIISSGAVLISIISNFGIGAGIGIGTGIGIETWTGMGGDLDVLTLIVGLRRAFGGAYIGSNAPNDAGVLVLMRVVLFGVYCIKNNLYDINPLRIDSRLVILFSKNVM